jgi:hypothetical protein
MVHDFGILALRVPFRGVHPGLMCDDNRGTGVNADQSDRLALADAES